MEENTKSKKLTRKDLFSMAIGNIIGVGIMTMTGIAIGFTGRNGQYSILSCRINNYNFSNPSGVYRRYG